ncbi:hypothetical protein GCM10007216_12200 [Thalassobacillus devorans]|uniref:Transposase n=1 Tax=Thalassobacillus devorans TaxID=279813 RepID=A0ABQ1NQU6_9BACI|nr:hypothetical protein [Thalassobacillus devorans]NIK28839.1 hypothetical protein [Thalassobacillus devorans]GGC83156.1 hypothetical protein GCM10007216_12200 [Thalassobacillus devorans]
MAKGNKKYDYDLNQVKQLLEESDKNYRQIAAETGCPYSNVVYHGRKIRGKRYKNNVQEMVSFVTSEDKAKASSDMQINTSKVSEEKQNNIATPSFEITTANLSLEQAEAKAKNMIEAARVLGVNKVTLQISSHDEN